MELEKKLREAVDWVRVFLPTKGQVMRFVSSRRGKRTLCCVAAVLALAVWTGSGEDGGTGNRRSAGAPQAMPSATNPMLLADMMLQGMPPALAASPMGKAMYFDQMEREHQMRADELESRRRWNEAESRNRADREQLAAARAARMAPQYAPVVFRNTVDGSWVTSDPARAAATGTPYLPPEVIRQGQRAGMFR